MLKGVVKKAVGVREKGTGVVLKCPGIAGGPINGASRKILRNFFECSDFFANFWAFSYILGSFRTRSDMFGHVRMHSDASGCVRRRLDTSRNFGFFWAILVIFRCFLTLGVNYF